MQRGIEEKRFKLKKSGTKYIWSREHLKINLKSIIQLRFCVKTAFWTIQ